MANSLKVCKDVLVLNYATHHEVIWRNGGIPSCTIHLNTTCKLVVSLTMWPLAMGKQTPLLTE